MNSFVAFLRHLIAWLESPGTTYVASVLTSFGCGPLSAKSDAKIKAA